MTIVPPPPAPPTCPCAKSCKPPRAPRRPSPPSGTWQGRLSHRPLERLRMDDAARILDQLREEPWTPFPEAVDLLGRLPVEAAPALIAALDDPNRHIRAMAARA